MSKKILKIIVAIMTVCVAITAVACTPFGTGTETAATSTPVIETPEHTATPTPTVSATPTPSPSGSPDASPSASPAIEKPVGAITPDPSLYPNASESPAATAPAGAPTTSPSTKTAHSHTFKTTKVEATTSSQGYTVYQCTGCEFSYRDNYTPKLSSSSTTTNSSSGSTSNSGSGSSTSSSGSSSTTTKTYDPYLDDSGSSNDPYSDDYREDSGTHTHHYYKTTDSNGNVIYRCSCGNYYYPDDDYSDYGDGRYEDIYAD